MRPERHFEDLARPAATGQAPDLLLQGKLFANTTLYTLK